MSILNKFISFLRRLKRLLTGRPTVRDRHLEVTDRTAAVCRAWGYNSKNWSGLPKVLMAAGHGYGNVGDEAQCGACISRWRRVVPECRITLFSPNPAYTEALHGEKCEWAPRVAWFRANTSGPYDGNTKRFERFFFWLKLRLTFSAFMLKRGLPLLFCNPREASILHILQEHDLLHISGGGFLTGKTRSRLWENALLMRICQILEIPYILTGHNIGVFQNDGDRKVAKMGLKGAKYIGLRDRGISEKELAEVGIRGKHIESTCDDALFCAGLNVEAVNKYLAAAGADPERPWVAVNFHEWGQPLEDRDSIEQRFAKICDLIVSDHSLQVIFIAMTPTDVEPEQNVIRRMKQTGILAPYSPDYKVVRGIIANAQFVFTMKHHPIVFAQGEGVPVIAVSLDSYYFHKNKGALANTDHVEYLVDAPQFYTDKPLTLVRNVLAERERLARQMKDWTANMSRIELEPYRLALDLPRLHSQDS